MRLHCILPLFTVITTLSLICQAASACDHPDPDAVELASSCPTHAPMHIPNWGLQANLRPKSGAGPFSWGNASTWVDAKTGAPVNRIPNANDVVLIPTDTTVTIDGGLALARIVTVRGTLFFSRNQQTTLRVNTLLVNYDGTLDAGHPARDGQLGDPIVGSVLIQLGVGGLLPKYYTSTPPSPPTLYGQVYNTTQSAVYDPREYGCGMVVLGKFIAAGAIKTPFVRLASSVSAATNSLSTAAAPVNWRVNDRLAIPDTREAYRRQFVDNKPDSQSETATCRAISGKVVALNSGLVYAHNGNETLFPHVANLTRNITIETYQATVMPGATGVARAHIMATGPARIDLDDVAFVELGRTQTGVFTNFDAKDSSGNLAPTFGNQVGRYALHFHMMDGTFDGVDPNDPRTALNHFRARVTNCAFDDSFTLPVGNTGSFPGGYPFYPTKWQISIHQTSRVLLQGNVFYGAKGAAVVTEDGSEGWNEIIANLAFNVRGVLPDNLHWTPQLSDNVSTDLSFGHVDDPRFDAHFRGSEGTGFWLTGDADMVWGNVAADCGLAGIVVFPRRDNGRDPLGQRSAMTFPRNAADERGSWINWQSPSGDHLAFGWQAGDLPYVRDSKTGTLLVPRNNPYGDNEIYGCLKGMEKWGCAPVTIWNMTVWNCHNAFEPWQSGGDMDADALAVNGLFARGDANTAVMVGAGDGWEPAFGVNDRFHPVCGQLSNLNIANFQVAVRASTPVGINDTGISFQSDISKALRVRDLVIENLTSRCPVGVDTEADLHYKVDMLWDGTPFAQFNRNPSRTYIRNCRFLPPAIGGDVTAVFTRLFPELGMDVRANAHDEIYLDGFYIGSSTTNQGSYRVYYPEQAPNHSYPLVGQVTRGGLNSLLPATNLSAWLSSALDVDGRKAWMGEVAPSNTMTWQQTITSGTQSTNYRIVGLLAPMTSDDIWLRVQQQPYSLYYGMSVLPDHIEGLAWNRNTPWQKTMMAIYVDGQQIGTTEATEPFSMGAGTTRRTGIYYKFDPAFRKASGGAVRHVRVIGAGSDGILGTDDDTLLLDTSAVIGP